MANARYTGNGPTYIRATSRGVLTLLALVYSMMAATTPALADYLYAATGDGIVQVDPSGTSMLIYPVMGRLPTLSTDGAGDLYTVRSRSFIRIGGGNVVAVIDDAYNLIAADPQGNVYVPNQNLIDVEKLAPDGTLLHLYPNVLAFSVAADGAGDLFVVNGRTSVQRIAPDGTVVTLPQEPGPGNQSLAVDGAGNLYFLTSSAYNAPPPYSILRLAPDGTVTTLATGLTDAQSIAADPAGNVFVSQAITGANGDWVQTIGLLSGGAVGPPIASFDLGIPANPQFPPDNLRFVASPLPVEVPEPATAPVFAVLGSGLLARRRKQPGILKSNCSPKSGDA